jgi:1-acyl-sn-glycerol-3-phosphate acyltransferase
VVAHRAYFDLFQSLRIISQGLGFTEAKLANVQQVLDQGELLLLFPEGESGNFKSSLDRYKLRPFHTGFVRTALQTGAPIIPCIVIGAEESNFNLGNINLNKFTNHLVVPLPLNVMPLPAKWTIEFLPPIDLSGESKEFAHDREWVRQKAQEIQQMMQHEIDKRLRARRSIYF